MNIGVKKAAASRLSKIDLREVPFGKYFSDHMFVADYTDGVWKHGQITPYETIPLSPATAALHYGQAIFEGLKAYKHTDDKVTIFRPYKNAARFNQSARRMCMPQLPEDIFVQSIAAVVLLDKDWIPLDAHHALYIRPCMFATDTVLGVKPSSSYKYMVLLSPTGPAFSKDLQVTIETNYSRAAPGGFGYAKAAGNYGGAMLALQEAQKKSYHQIVWTDAIEHVYIEEMGSANVMFLVNGTLLVPSICDTILDGVTRDSILTLARSWNFPIEERRVTVAEILAAANNGTLVEAFGVGTAAAIASIAEINYQGQTYRLPDATKRIFSAKILKTLDGIQRGVIPDQYQWNYTIPNNLVAYS